MPDADPTLAGVITDCTNFIPYEGGMEASPSGSIPNAIPALASDCRGAAVITKLDGTRRILAGVATNIYEISAGSWSSVGSGYTTGADDRWCFTQFGDSTIAANMANTIQRSTGAGFSAIATAPKAKIVFSVGAFVMALSTNDGTYGDNPNRWWCSAAYDDTSWTPSVSTLATTGLLVSSPGKITAGGKLGEYAVAYKEQAVYIGQFVGAPAVWDWQQVPGTAGCVGQEAWADIGGAHFFVGQDNFWIFDGSRPTPIGQGQVRQWFYDNSDPASRFRTKVVFDRQQNRVFILYPSNGSSVCNQALVYHLLTKQWGRVNVTVEALLNYVSPGATIDTMASGGATIDSLTSYSFDSQYWLSGGASLSYFDTSHQLMAFAGTAGVSGFTTGDAGDDDMYTLLTKIRLRFAPGYKPSSAVVTTYTKPEVGASLSVASTASMSDGKFDVIDSARWHRASFTFNGTCRVIGIDATLVPEGNS